MLSYEMSAFEVDLFTEYLEKCQKINLKDKMYRNGNNNVPRGPLLLTLFNWC